MPGLRDILDAATGGRQGEFIGRPEQLAAKKFLEGQAPELAEICIRQSEWIDRVIAQGGIHMFDAEGEAFAMLARLDRIGKEQSDGGTE